MALLPKTGSKEVDIALRIGVFLIVVIVIWQLYKAFKGVGRATGKALSNEYLSAQTSVPVTRINVARSVAQDVEKGIYRLPIVGTILWVADDPVVNALNQLVSDKEAALASEFFKQNTGDSLKIIASEKWLSTDMVNRINKVVLQNLV